MGLLQTKVVEKAVDKVGSNRYSYTQKLLRGFVQRCMKSGSGKRF